MLRILLVQHHTIMREALAIVLRQQPDVAEVFEARSLAEARTLLHAIDIALIDIDLSGGHCTDLPGELRHITSTCTVLALTADTSSTLVEVVREADGAAVLHKGVPIAELIERIRLASGSPMTSKHGMNGSVHSLRPRPCAVIRELTARERALLQALAEGLTDTEIALRLEVQPQTVRKYLMSIFGKLGVASRLQAVVYALRYGLVRLDEHMR